MDISEVMLRFNDTKPEDWRQVGDAWVHRDCIVEDADIQGGVFRHGTFNGGVFRGGTFHGGRFYGGRFYGGTFNDGRFDGGTFHGGVFRGGLFCDGTFHCGRFYDGTFNGGTFKAGTFYSGMFKGGTWNRSPLFIQGTQYFVCESDNGYIASGCMRMPSEWWTTENIAESAEKNDYTEEQVEEYLQIFELVKSQMELTGPVVD